MITEDEALSWPLESYGVIIRGDETTSEDQVGIAATPDIARRMVACWNAFHGIRTEDIDDGMYDVVLKNREQGVIGG